MKKPESAPQAAATTMASKHDCRIEKPKSCQVTPMMIDVRPTSDATWMSMPPVIMTKVTKSEIIMTDMESSMLVRSSCGLRNLGLAAPKMTNSRTMSATSMRFQLACPLLRNDSPFFLGAASLVAAGVLLFAAIATRLPSRSRQRLPGQGKPGRAGAHGSS